MFARGFAVLVSDEGNVRRDMTTSLKRRRNEMSMLRLMAANEVKPGTAGCRTPSLAGLLQPAQRIVSLRAPNRLALEAGIGRSAARCYVRCNFEGGHDG
jgi:hypothetical protein